MERIILHSDLNNFFASVECLYHPELGNGPLVVGGSPEERHGVVLAKNEHAKKYGIKTGEALWQAYRKCPQLVAVRPHFTRYAQCSKSVREIYRSYTDYVEPFGLDEAWLDVSECAGISGEALAQEIRERVHRELGLTVSIGVSFNKVFAKLGSDLKKPNAVTVISRENYRDKVWSLPVGDLLYVGPATTTKLSSYGIATIGQLAQTTPDLLRRCLGKMGEVIHRFANGLDNEPVAQYDSTMEIKSIGNSTTTYRDLENANDVKVVIFTLAESVAARVREQGFHAATLSITVRDTRLQSFSRQCKLENPSSLAGEYAAAAMQLFAKHYRWELPVRSLGLSVCDFSHGNVSVQLDLMCSQQRRDREEKLEGTLDNVRKRFGSFAVQRAVLLQDPRLCNMAHHEEQTSPLNGFV